MEDFLIKYTKVLISFVKKYLSFYNMCDRNKFGINITSTPQKKVKNLEYTTYMVSLDTFEQIYLVSNTTIG